MTTANDPAAPGGGSPPPPAPATPPAPPSATPPAATPPGTPPPAAESEPHWLSARLQQQERALLRKLGLESVDDAKEKLAKAKKLEDDEAARQQANLTELEKEREARKLAEQEATRLKAAQAESVRQQRLAEACAEQGVKNVGYARFLVAEKLKTNPDMSEADALAEFLKQDDQRAALGLTAPVPAPAANPPTTVPPLPGGPGGAPPPASPNGAPRDVMAMSAQDWQAHKRAMGLR